MIKPLNILVLAFLLSACSSQESNENNTSSKPVIEEKTTITTDDTTKEKSKLVENIKESNKAEIAKPTVEKTTTKQEASANKALFTLTTLDGKTINVNETEGGLVFEEFKEKVVLLIFFGYRCPPCLAEVPVLKALTDKGHKDLEIIALEVQGLPKNKLADFKEKKGINYNLISGEDNYEFISYIGDKANWQGAIPFLIGFNKKGAVQVVHVGGIGASEFDNIYNSLTKVEKK